MDCVSEIKIYYYYVSGPSQKACRTRRSTKYCPFRRVRYHMAQRHLQPPSRVLSFAINSSIDTLPTFRNLELWGKKMSSNCKLCGNTQTLLHVLAGCKTILDQGRYTWRHNCVLNHIEMYIRVSQIMPTSSAIYQVDRSVDLPSHPKSLLHQHAPILSSTIPMLM